MNRKLKSTSGESIAEVLIAMLIVSLGSVLFVTMVIASRNIIQKSDKAYQQYIEAHNSLVTSEMQLDSATPYLFIKVPNQQSVPVYSEKIKVFRSKNDPDYFVYEANDD